MQLQFNFFREMQTFNVHDKLNKSMDSNPEQNYDILLKSIKDTKTKLCLPNQVVKYYKKKHKKYK